MRPQNFTMKKIFTMIAVCICMSAFAQKNFWKQISDYQAITLNKGKQLFDPNGFVPSVYKLYQLDENNIAQIIKQAPMEGAGVLEKSHSIVPFPVGNGKVEMFRIVEAPVLMPKLQAKYSNIRSYAGQSIDNPTNTIRFDITPIALHATIGNANGKKIYINPINEKAGLYLINERTDKDKAPGNFTCTVDGNTLKPDGADVNKTTFVGNADDGKLHIYRLALCITGKWSQSIMTGTEVTTQDSINTVMSAITGYLVRVNEVYERDLAIRLVYADNEDTLIFLNPNTDPFTGSLNSQCQKTCDNYIGDANYDIGHVIDKAGNNGNAGCINCVCKTGSKGSGMTQYNNVSTPQLIDYFVIDYWTHEMGHQLGANHSFTYSSEGTSAQIEPGSGVTIMGYAGITGNTDVAPHSNDLFSCGSIAQISNSWKNALQGGKCAVIQDDQNTAPVVNAGADYVIPTKTPFVLTGNASDADVADVLSYVWEQTDVRENSGFSTIPKSKNTKGPMFRTYNYSEFPVRYFPQLSDILLGKDSTKWEVLPSVSRDLNFRLTARDNHVGGGTNKSDDILVTVDGNSGPFIVTYPANNENWNDGATYQVLWDVAKTNNDIVNCQLVNIYLSVDGGNTFPYLLKENTANNGAAEVTVPDLPAATTTARIKVEAVNNIFFAISKKDFSIANALPVSWLSFTVSKNDTRSALLSWSTANEINNNHFEVERSINGFSFIKITTVTAGKNTNVVQQYSFTDNNLNTGTYYYRIKQVDNDGKFTYSKTVSVSIDANGISVSVQPNPASEKTTIIFNKACASAEINITNTAGSKVYNKLLKGVQLNYQLPIDVSSFAKGIYFINIKTDNESTTQKLVVE